MTTTTSNISRKPIIGNSNQYPPPDSSLCPCTLAFCSDLPSHTALICNGQYPHQTSGQGHSQGSGLVWWTSCAIQCMTCQCKNSTRIPVQEGPSNLAVHAVKHIKEAEWHFEVINPKLGWYILGVNGRVKWGCGLKGQYKKP